MIKIALRLPREQVAAFREVGRRVGHVRFVNPMEAADAVITGDLRTASEAARGQRHLLLFQPEREEARPIAEACAGSRTCFMPAHPWRFLPSVREIHNALGSGQLGQPGLVRIHRWTAFPSETADLLDTILPEMDLLNWIFGAIPSTVYSLGRRIATGQYLQAHLGFAAGGMAIVDYAWDLPPGTAYDAFSLIGSNGAAYADDHRNMQLEFHGGDPTGLKTGQGLSHIREQLRAFVRAIRGEERPAVLPGDIFAALEVAKAVRASLDSRWVLKRVEDRYEPV